MSLLKRIGSPGAGSPGQDSSQVEEGKRQTGAPKPAEASRLAGRAPSRRAQEDNTFNEIKELVQMRVLEQLDSNANLNRNDERTLRQVQDIFKTVMDSENIVLGRNEREQLYKTIVNDMLGYGPLELLLNNPEISEVMVNGPKQIYIEKKGKLTLTDITFQDNAHVMRIIERIVAPLGRRIDESSPMVDARLPDGSRVNAIIPPLSLVGPAVTIRKFKEDTLGMKDLINFGSISEQMGDFLQACVEARLNLVVSGGTGSGKTTLLNVLSNFIPSDERIITVENAAELQLKQEHVVRLESRPPNVEGKGEVTIRDLVINCLRMRPERIIVGECRGGETLDMLQAMNTGHDGSMTTVHANTPRDAIGRIETMCMMAGMDLPQRAIREQIVSAVHVIVQQSRLKDGTRKVSAITEVQGMEGDVPLLNDIFIFEQTGLDEKGKIAGTLRPTGARPKFLEKFETLNIFLPSSIFGYGGDSFM